MICQICESENAATNEVIDETIKGSGGAYYNAFVCKRCFSLDRITRVTCRSYSKFNEGEREKVVGSLVERA